jgi:hypothetical protein
MANCSLRCGIACGASLLRVWSKSTLVCCNVIGQNDGVIKTVVLIGWWLIRTTVERSMKPFCVIKAEVLEDSVEFGLSCQNKRT